MECSACIAADALLVDLPPSAGLFFVPHLFHFHRDPSLFGVDGRPLMLVYVATFGTLFLLLRWWRQTNPLRSKRLSTLVARGLYGAGQHGGRPVAISAAVVADGNCDDLGIGAIGQPVDLSRQTGPAGGSMMGPFHWLALFAVITSIGVVRSGRTRRPAVVHLGILVVVIIVALVIWLMFSLVSGHAVPRRDAPAAWGLAEVDNTGRASRERSKTLDRCQREAARNPNSADVQCSLGQALADLARFDEAMPHFQKALQLKPDFVAAYLGLGSTYNCPSEIRCRWGHTSLPRSFEPRPELPPGRTVAWPLC